MGVELHDIRAAADRIRPFVSRTPVLRSPRIDDEVGAEIHFKCENLQNIGAFKVRGAVNAVLCLSDEEAADGVVTHSSGNHATALAYAASVRGIGCTVVMPEDSNPVKVDNARAHGAEIVFCPRGQRERTTERVLAERGGTLVHPFEDPRVIAGQGTAALELLEQAGEVDAVLVPVGGGGLAAGTAITFKTMRPAAGVIGVEPEEADDAFRSIASGQRQPAVPDPQTCCDGLLTGIGEPNFEILRDRGVTMLTVSEGAVLDAARSIVRHMRIVAEPSAATVLAAVREHRERFRGLRLGAILSGGNTDLRWLDD